MAAMVVMGAGMVIFAAVFTASMTRRFKMSHLKLRMRAVLYKLAYLAFTLPPVGSRVLKSGLAKSRLKTSHAETSRTILAVKNEFKDGDNQTQSDLEKGPENSITLISVAFLEDNYAWLIVDYVRGSVAAVDPADAVAVAKAVAAESRRSGQRLRLTDILVTHYHADHAGGNADLAKLEPRIRIHAPANERLFGVPGATNFVEDGSVIQFGDLEIAVIETPGHTQGHVSYHVPIQVGCERAVIFTGDTLFVAGAGRFFEGSGEDALRSMKFYRSLHPSTLVCPGHEYTVDNLDFCAWLEPDRKDILAARQTWARGLRDLRKPTVPVPLEHEFSFNPFLRFDDPDLIAAIPDAQQRDAESRGEDNVEKTGLMAGVFEDPALLLQAVRDLKDAGSYRVKR